MFSNDKSYITIKNTLNNTDNANSNVLGIQEENGGTQPPVKVSIYSAAAKHNLS